MNTSDRRTFLKLLGAPAVAAALPLDLSRALAIPAFNRTGSIADVEHIVFLMQENRSFDHYFGTLRGVRGFADPRAVKLPSGQPVWFQPDGSGHLLPFRPDVQDLGATFLPDPPHGWTDTHAAWNGGRHDRWVPNKGVTTMTYHTRKDLPYQYALADAFTVCDNYHCSLMGPTDPNRYHMWTGWVGNDGAAGGPVITNAEAGYDWSTYPERLERAGISWKIYQDVGVGLDAAGFWGWTEDPYIGNFGETTNEIFPGDPDHPSGPYGLGIRVPMLIVSPWSRGGWVNSQLFDHTSMIRFLEARFGHHHPDLIETNITPWRRAVVGDLTSAFDFRAPNTSRRIVLPSTDEFKPDDLVRHPDEAPVPPAHDVLPRQERGVRPARALPYALHAHGVLDEASDSFQIHFRNIGQAAAVFQVRSAGSAEAPRTYTVGPHKHLADVWDVQAGAVGYDLSVYGPNGFYRRFKGGLTGRHRANLDVRAIYSDENHSIALEISNRASQTTRVSILNGYKSQNIELVLGPGEAEARSWSLTRTSGWYDLTILAGGDEQFECRFAGHVEDGDDSISDPAMGGIV